MNRNLIPLTFLAFCLQPPAQPTPLSREEIFCGGDAIWGEIAAERSVFRQGDEELKRALTYLQQSERFKNFWNRSPRRRHIGDEVLVEGKQPIKQEREYVECRKFNKNTIKPLWFDSSTQISSKLGKVALDPSSKRSRSEGSPARALQTSLQDGPYQQALDQLAAELSLIDGCECEHIETNHHGHALYLTTSQGSYYLYIVHQDWHSNIVQAGASEKEQISSFQHVSELFYAHLISKLALRSPFFTLLTPEIWYSPVSPESERTEVSDTTCFLIHKDTHQCSQVKGPLFGENLAQIFSENLVDGVYIIADIARLITQAFFPTTTRLSLSEKRLTAPYCQKQPLCASDDQRFLAYGKTPESIDQFLKRNLLEFGIVSFQRLLDNIETLLTDHHEALKKIIELTKHAVSRANQPPGQLSKEQKTLWIGHTLQELPAQIVEVAQSS